MGCPSHPTAFGGQSSRSRLDSGPSAGFLRRNQPTQGRAPLNNGGAGGFARNHPYSYNSHGGDRTGSVAHAPAGTKNPNFNNNRRANSFSSSRSRTPRQVQAYPQNQPQQQSIQSFNQQFDQQQLHGLNLPNQSGRRCGARNRRRRQTTSPQAHRFNSNPNQRRTQSEPWNHDVEMLDVTPIVEPDEDVIMEDAPPLVFSKSAPDPRFQDLAFSAAAMHELANHILQIAHQGND
ncbi:hypothetical protein N7510_007776 [Penicillium lagena]|uniref:uncharacterized protein n=1 Tax=Penicillium lagena TaxID=94218 RepID=UPI0025412EEF|nr:uncharacterized protein N7510_007776 [Penicillium lagena]KAJ5611057.1 hypothetical protein N7510_007776 [Penicillium lagena]